MTKHMLLVKILTIYWVLDTIVVNEIQIVEQLCDQQIIDFANGDRQGPLRFTDTRFTDTTIH
jgi:hypothetical protein